MNIKFTARLEPVPFKRTATNGRRHFNEPRYSDFKLTLGLFANHAMRGHAPLSGAVRLTVHVFRPRKPNSLGFGDADNHLKAVADALNGICYIDDRQVVEGHVFLHHGQNKLIIEVEEL